MGAAECVDSNLTTANRHLGGFSHGAGLAFLFDEEAAG